MDSDQDVIDKIVKENEPVDYVESELYKFNSTLLAHEKTLIHLSKAIRILVDKVKRLEQTIEVKK